MRSGPIFFGHAKFDTNKFLGIFLFNECCGLQIFCRGWVWGPTFFHHEKFEVKNILKFFPLPSTLDWIFQRRGLGQLFLVTPNLRSKIFWNFFPLPSALDSEFVGGGMSGHQHFLVTLNLRSKIFRNFLIYRVLWILNFLKGVWAPTFFYQAIFEVKNCSKFLIYWVLWSLNFSQGGLGTNFFYSCQICGQKVFWIFLLYRALWTLNLSGEKGPGTNFFWSG